MPSDRDVLFSNESFVIGVLQAVSGGSLVAAIAQFPSLKTIAGLNALLLFMTFMTIALAAAVIAALCKHHYKMWDVKAVASIKKGQPDQAKKRGRWSDAYLWSMRGAMVAACTTILIALAVLVGAFWIHGIKMA